MLLFLLSVVRRTGWNGAVAEILCPRSEQNWWRLSRNHGVACSRTNVVFELAAASCASLQAAGVRGRYCAAHVDVGYQTDACAMAPQPHGAFHVTRSCRNAFPAAALAARRWTRAARQR